MLGHQFTHISCPLTDYAFITFLVNQYINSYRNNQHDATV